MTSIKYCTRCVMPNIKPDLTFDSEGVCSACRYAELKNTIDWNQKRGDLEVILEMYKSKDGSNYDCIIPVSGGKDSHFQTYMIKHVRNFNPLLVTWHPCKRTSLGEDNLRNLIDTFGVDHVEFIPNPRVYRQLFRLGFEETGDPCFPCHVGIFTYPVRVAVQYKVPLIIWGENSQLEYGGPVEDAVNPILDKKWVEKYSQAPQYADKNLKNWVGKYGLTLKDLIPYTYPSDEEIKRVGVTGIFLGSFIKWDARSQVERMKQYGFNTCSKSIGTYTNYENLDCGFVDIHDFMKYVKYGFGRATDHACIDIRNNRLSREGAVKLVEKYDGEVAYIKDFCDFIRITEEDFWKTVDRFRNPEIWKKDEKKGWKLRTPVS